MDSISFSLLVKNKGCGIVFVEGDFEALGEKTFKILKSLFIDRVELLIDVFDELSIERYDVKCFGNIDDIL